MIIKKILVTSIIGISIILGLNGCANNNLTIKKYGSLKKGTFIRYET